MSIIKKPIITEKMTNDTELFNRYAFVVDRKANKIQIKKAVEEQYDVVVDSVRTMVCIGKKRVRGTKSGMIVGKTSTYKKAIVQLPEGESIDFYSNIYDDLHNCNYKNDLLVEIIKNNSNIKDIVPVEISDATGVILHGKEITGA